MTVRPAPAVPVTRLDEFARILRQQPLERRIRLNVYPVLVAAQHQRMSAVKSAEVERHEGCAVDEVVPSVMLERSPVQIPVSQAVHRIANDGHVFEKAWDEIKPTLIAE